MRLIIELFIVATVFLFCSCSPRNDMDPGRMQAFQTGFSNQINKTLALDIYKDVDVSIRIQTPDGKGILFDRDAYHPHITASVFKIVSSGVALEKFGPQKRFETLIASESDPNQGVVEGNLYIVGQGDSSLTRDDLTTMAKKLYEMGIREIRQDLVYDDSYFDQEKNRFGNNARNLYAPPSALTVDYGWIDVKVTRGSPLALELVPKSGYAKISSQLTWSSEDVWGRPSLTFKERDWGDEFSVVGTLAAKDRQYHYLHLGVSRPSLYAATLFQEALTKQGISCRGRIRSGRIPENPKFLLKHEGLKLEEIVKVMNQESNNVIAEMINKSLGATFVSLPGTREKGLSVLGAFFMEELGFAKGTFSIGDSSGLSIENRLSAHQVCAILGRFYGQERLRKAFISTLAEQGHHPHAMNPVPPEGIKIFVKTGTLSVQGVNTVAGYIILDKTGDVFTFAILTARKRPGAMTYSGTLTNPLLSAIVRSLETVRKGGAR